MRPHLHSTPLCTVVMALACAAAATSCGLLAAAPCSVDDDCADVEVCGADGFCAPPDGVAGVDAGRVVDDDAGPAGDDAGFDDDDAGDGDDAGLDAGDDAGFDDDDDAGFLALDGGFVALDG